MSSHSPSSASLFEIQVNALVDDRSLAHHPELVTPIFKRHQLSAYLTQYEEFTGKDDDSFYHGRAHAYATALNCYEGALYAHLSSAELRAVMVAGLFHDIGHSRGEYFDRYNINRAVFVLKHCHDQLGAHERLKPEELELALQAIKDTTWPHVKKAIGDCSRVIRDADLMTLYLPDATKAPMLRGLMKEMSVTQGRCTEQAFFQSQARFATGVEWHTRWGKMKAMDKNWPLLARSLPQLFAAYQQPSDVTEMCAV